MAADTRSHGVITSHHCPECGSFLERQHRNALDRWVSLFRSVHRYRCSNGSCGWEGVLGRLDGAEATAARHDRRVAMLWFLIGAVFAVAAVETARTLRHPPRTGARSAQLASARPALTGAAAQAHATPAGHDFDGEALPGVDSRVARNSSALTLRNRCAWGQPGGNPYRGTVAQALAAAQVPADVARQLQEMVDRGWSLGDVEISRAGIRTLDDRLQFSRDIDVMAFGTMVCFNTRVNFVPGHVELGALYQAADRRGKVYTVMVPYVCGNVSLISRQVLTEYHDAPEPGTVALVLSALGLLGWTRRRGATRRSPP